MLESIASHLDAIAALSPAWKFALVFLFMAVESSFIPFPSEVVMIPAGFLAARGELAAMDPTSALVLCVAVGVAGSLAGAYVNYFLALWVGKPFLERYGKWFFLSPAALDRSCEVFNRYGAAATFVCRMVPAIRQLISIPAGISRLPLASFTLFPSLGAGIWAAILAAAGYAVGRSAGDITYLGLCRRGRDMTMAHLPLVIGGALLLVGLHFAVTKLVMGRRR
jgi:membrane protein DedA with SNARE-associated domain